MRLKSWEYYVLALITLFIAVFLIAVDAKSPLFILPATVMGLGGIVIGIGTYGGLSRLIADAPSRSGSAVLAGFVAWLFGIVCSVTTNEVLVLRDASPLPPYGDAMPELMFAAWNGFVTGVEGIIFGAGVGQERER